MGGPGSGPALGMAKGGQAAVKTIAVAMQKGGSGKSSTAVNPAAALGEQRRVALRHSPCKAATGGRMPRMSSRTSRHSSIAACERRPCFQFARRHRSRPAGVKRKEITVCFDPQVMTSEKIGRLINGIGYPLA